MKYQLISESNLTKNQVLLVPIFKNVPRRGWADLLKEEHFKGDRGEMFYSLLSTTQKTQHAIFVGLGEEKKATAANICNALASGIRLAQDKKRKEVAISLPEKFFSLGAARDLGERLAQAIGVVAYTFNNYITDKERHVIALDSVSIVGVPAAKKNQFQDGLKNGVLIAEAVSAVRDMGNHPAADMHPEKMGTEAVRLARGLAKLSVKVLHKKEIVREKMGGLLGVSSGSVRPPVFIIMEYKGGRVKDAPVVLVGKGITFDSGGISLKPGDKMDEMKFDMMGGATVIGTLVAAAKLKLPVNVVGLVPASENLPSGSAYRPGDILRTYSGKTIEVLNTDAEGRIILADALSYAKKFKPKFVVDLATLTGACVSALGEKRTGLWSTDEKLASKIQAVAETTGEMVWRLPLGDDFSEMVKSPIADVKNIGERWGSANSAAAFLQVFVEGPWAHLDIAGTAYSQKLEPARRAGASGWGVALLLELLKR